MDKMKSARVVVARTFGQRSVGLLGRSKLRACSGLWFDCCKAVHSFGMSIPLDLVFLNRDLRVLWTIQNWQPGRFAICRQASSLLELADGSIGQLGWRPGTQLVGRAWPFHLKGKCDEFSVASASSLSNVDPPRNGPRSGPMSMGRNCRWVRFQST